MSGGRAVARVAGPKSASPAKKRPGSSSSTAIQPAAAQQQQQQNELQIIQNPHHFTNNAGVVYFLRIFMTIIAGAAVGILGVEGWGGFIGYLISQAVCTLPILAKCGGNYVKYLATWDKVYLEHIFSSTAILSYILFWMMFYNICHVF